MFKKKYIKSLKYLKAMKNRVIMRNENIASKNETDDIVKMSFSKRNIISDMIALLSIITAVVLLLSLFSLDTKDLALFENITQSTTNNMVGKLGALVSGHLFLIIGNVSFLIPIMLFITGLNTIIKNYQIRLNIVLVIASALILLVLTIIFDMVLFNLSDYRKGGIIGSVLRDMLKSVIGDTGIILSLILALVSLIIVYKKIPLKTILSKINIDTSKIYKSKNLILEKYKCESLEKIQNESREISNRDKKTKKNILNTIISYTPFISKKNVSKLQYKVSPFIEIVNIETEDEMEEELYEDKYYKNRKKNMIENIEIDEDEYIKESLIPTYESTNKVDIILNDIKNINKKEYRESLNHYSGAEEDLGLTLAKAIYGKNIIIKEEKNSILSDNFDVNIEKINPSINPEDSSIKNSKKNTTPYEDIYVEDSYEEYKNTNIAVKEDEYNFEVPSHENKSNKTVVYEDEIFTKKPFEFNMGYSAFKKYNREDHIPSIESETRVEEKEEYSDFKDSYSNINETNNSYEDEYIKEYPIENNYNNQYKNIEPIENKYQEQEAYREDENNYMPLKETILEKEEQALPQKKDLEYNKNMYVQKSKTKKALYSIHELIQSNYNPKLIDKNYRRPSIELLKRSIPINDHEATDAIRQTAFQLENTLLDFNIEAKVTGVSRGPVITRYELELASGTRVSKIVSLTDNIALALASESVRIIAPIPGRHVIGIEIPNKVRGSVCLRDVLESSDFKNTKSEIPFVLGKGIYGNNIVTDMADAPHLLVAGTTGSGKSVCLSTIILSLLFKFRPDELKFIFIDKKRVELSIYNGIPHLMSPVVSDDKKATVVLRHTVEIMERRYERMEKFFVRNVKAYNEKIKQLIKDGETDFEGEPLELFPYIVLVIDELHNLMVVASKEVEDLISRLAGMSRAVGIHLIIATQRPSADVVTGVIKANLPTRIAFQVPNKINSRIIIDMAGAEQLLGKGDALFCSSGTQMPERVQGAFVSDNEVKDVVDFLSGQIPTLFDESLIYSLEKNNNDDKSSAEDDILDEELWEDAVAVVSRTGKASASFLQRKLKIGYNRAARIIDLMEQQGLVGPENGSKPRDVFTSTYE